MHSHMDMQDGDQGWWTSEGNARNNNIIIFDNIWIT